MQIDNIEIGQRKVDHKPQQQTCKNIFFLIFRTSSQFRGHTQKRSTETAGH